MHENWRRMRLYAPAKINLDLRVLGRRADRFHEVRTILQTIELRDVVIVAARRGPFTVRSRTPAMPKDRDNLVWSAAAVLWRALERSGTPHGIAVTITKRIPSAAGLGGASSDAAATLRGLARLWAPKAADAVVREVAAIVGSDVPFFLEGGTVLATGRGEQTRRLAPLHKHWVVVAVPAFGISTPRAYRWWDTTKRSSTAALAAPRKWRHRLDLLCNDLEPPVVARHPEIGDMVARLRESGAESAAMSGSGSSVFGLFSSQTAAAAARRRLRCGGWRTWLTRTIGSSECARLAAPARID